MIEIRFRCLCMSEEKGVHVRWRKPGEDLSAWMKKIVQPALGDAHKALSPSCPLRVLKYAKVPLSDNETRIGMKPKVRE